MELQALYIGGSYHLCEGDDFPGQQVPCFLFRTRDLGRTRELLKHMYVQLSVRLARSGNLAYCLEVPDRMAQPWAIPLRSADLEKLSQASRTTRLCPTSIAGEDGEMIDLHGFAADVEHDWSGAVARARFDFNQGALDQAMERVRPLAQEGRVPEAALLYGRCLREKGELREAIRWYGVAVAACLSPVGDRFIPLASAPLSDMGVAFKRLGEVDKAVHCFLHALQLRPNFPEALLSFSALFAGDETLFLLGPARVLAMGGHDALVESFLAAYAASAGLDAAMLLSRARARAKTVNLGEWPLASERFTSFKAFRKGLRQISP